MIRPAVFYTLAAVVPITALWLATPSARAAHGMAVSPFGWPSQLVVQCLAAVPLAVVFARWLVTRVKVTAAIPVLVAGLLGAVVAYFAISPLGESLDSSADFTVRCLVRSLVCLLLALPWVAAAQLGRPALARGWAMLVVGLVVAVVLPGVWANMLATENTSAAQNELAAERMARAFPLVDGVCDLDPNRQIIEAGGNLKMPALRARLAENIKGLTEDLAGTDPNRLKPSDRLLYANALVSLDRLTEAEPIYRELVRTQPEANLPLARTLHLHGRYDDSDTAVRELLAASLPQAEANPKARKLCVEGFDLLAVNATKRGDSNAREAVLKEGLERLPTEAGFFHLQLGRHYKLTGRPLDALRELDEAVRSDPAFVGPAAELLRRDIRETTPACLVGR